jgi:hypothetical protein
MSFELFFDSNSYGKWRWNIFVSSVIETFCDIERKINKLYSLSSNDSIY